MLHTHSILLFNPYSAAKTNKPLRQMVVRHNIWPSQCLQHGWAINFTWGLIKLVRARSAWQKKSTLHIHKWLPSTSPYWP